MVTISNPLKLSLPVILASGSPRRKELLTELGISFKIVLKDIDENFPDSLMGKDVAVFLAEKKAVAYLDEINDGNLVITADTIVCLDNEILNKPADAMEATRMLQKLSGKKHEVITAVCINSKTLSGSFFVSTAVYFKDLTDEEIAYYVTTHQPFDKAGGYGIQEWVGLTAIEKIEGSYHNVVGLPVKEIYDYLRKHYPAP